MIRHALYTCLKILPTVREPRQPETEALAYTSFQELNTTDWGKELRSSKASMRRDYDSTTIPYVKRCVDPAGPSATLHTGLTIFCPRILPLQSTRALVQSWRNSVTLTQMPSLHIMSRTERSGRFAFTSVMLKCFTFEIWNRRHQEPALMRTTSRQVWFVHVFRQ